MVILVFILGLGCGSFVNMLVFRTAIRYGLTPGGILNRVQDDKVSFCDYCGKQLSWYENIPVFSWVVQRGKSRCCGCPLPREYPIVELTTGLLFLLNYNFSFDYSGLHFVSQFPIFQTILGFVVVTMLVFAAVFDIKYMILPDFSTGILIVIAVVRIMLGGHTGPPVQYLLAAGGGAVFLLVLYWLTKGKGMGMGDVKLAVFMGLWLGWPKIVVAFYVAFVTGAVVGGGLMLVKKLKRKSIIAFGPFLILGILVAWWWGDWIIFNSKSLIFK